MNDEKKVYEDIENKAIGAEQQMVESFKSRFDGNPFNILAANVRAINEPDIRFIHDNVMYMLEAKKENQYNKANYPKQIFAKILMNRNLKIDIPGDTAVKYGIFLAYDNKQTDDIHVKLKANISKSDWFMFGKKFNATHVFLYDEINKEVYYSDWKYFLNDKPNVKSFPPLQEK